ncbi:MAG: 1-acyl-sn-glycerol-3-phosphate acyltransferase [Bdellovibrionota bacterium]|nr:MAG: 1-acyl-sn-glycerol-3-phosphate acyltransferase [Bdellovibrionota bacterium]
MKYAMGRRVVRGLLALFFRRIIQSGAPVVSEGPVLIVANHPNQALDPLLLVHLWHRPVYFLAKATLFRGALGFIVRRLNMLPIYRRHETADMSQNAETFKAVSAKLRTGAAVAIFPEGTSIGEPRILPMKTGAARIALQTLQEGPEDTVLAIQAVGVTYGDMYAFRSSVTLTVTEPLWVRRSDYQGRFDSPEAVRAITASIEQYIRTATVDLPDPELRLLTEKLSWFYDGLVPADDRERMHRIVENILARSNTDVRKSGIPESELRDSVQRRIDALRASMRALGLWGGERLHEPLTLTALLSTLLAFIGAGLFYIPYTLTGRIVRRKASEPVYVASMKLGFGLLLYAGWSAMLLLAAFLMGARGVWSYCWSCCAWSSSRCTRFAVLDRAG